MLTDYIPEVLNTGATGLPTVFIYKFPVLAEVPGPIANFWNNLLRPEDRCDFIESWSIWEADCVYVVVGWLALFARIGYM